MRRGWRQLPPRARIIILVLSVGSLAVLLFAFGVQARVLGLTDALPMLQRVLQNPEILRTEPAVLQQYLGLMGWLVTILVVFSLDGLLNLAVCILASTRKTYPKDRDKTTWVTGLWAVFLLLQLPTGIPAALVYWWFIVRPARGIATPEESPAAEAS